MKTERECGRALTTTDLGPARIRALSIGAQSLGAFAVGAIAVGAIARIFIKRARIRKLCIDELEVGILRVRDRVDEHARPSEKDENVGGQGF